MDNDYSKRELDVKFSDVHEKLDLILSQTTKTNGRVTKLEKWQWYTQGALAVLGFFVVPVLGWVLYQMVTYGNIDDKISIAVSRALASYEVQIK